MNSMTIDSLFEQLKHPNPHIREQAMFKIVDLHDEHTIVRLIDILDNNDTIYRRAAVKTLGLIGLEVITPIVECLLHNRNVIVRGSAAKVLAQIAINYPDLSFPENALKGLKIAIDDPNPVVHIASVMALGQIGVQAFDILVDCLKITDNVAVQVAIVNALSSIGYPRCIKVLTTLTNDKNIHSYVRESATSALSRLDLVINYKSQSY